MRNRLSALLFFGFLAAGAPNAAAQGLDPSLTLGIDDTKFIYAMAVQQDGKVLIGGDFALVGNTQRLNLARFNVDGTLDTSFDPGTNGIVTSLAVQPDGKIIVGGYFFSIGGGTGTINNQRLARLNIDGSVDVAFHPAPDAFVRCVVLQPDGKILISGNFSNVAGVSRERIARLNPDGSADAFNPGAVGFVNMLALQDDGGVIVAGNYSQLGGQPRTGLGRVNANGVLDTSFNPTVAGIAQVVAIQADGKILVGGSFSGLAGASRGNLGRLEISGSIDLTFNPQPGNSVYAIAVYANGQIAIGGDFQTIAAEVRSCIGIINADGSVDPFNPGASDTVYGLVIQPNGRLLVTGNFVTLGNGPRQRLGRLLPASHPTQALTYASGPGTITWTRGGPAPEVSAVEFATSSDGVTFTTLGAGTRVADGWQLTGIVVPSGPSQRLRARAWSLQANSSTGSSYLIETSAPLSTANVIKNGDFSNGTANWAEFGAPTSANIQSTVNGGVYEYYRVAPPPGTAGQAVVLQQSGMPIPAFGPVVVQFQAGNSDNDRKRMSVLVHDSNFSDLSVCTFWLPANSPLQTYQMRTHSTQAWSNLTVSFYAATAGSNGGAYRLDNVSAWYDPAGSQGATDCVDPLAPPEPGGADGPQLITNGDFSSGTTSWNIVFQMISQVAGNVFEFYRPAAQPDPAGVILQAVNTTALSGEIVTAQFKLGNSSSVRKRVTVLLHDLDFSDLSACTFWLEPGQPLSDYAMRSYATRAWGNATISIYAATVGDETWTRLDNVTLRKTPGGGTSGTNCVEPGSTLSASGAPSPQAMRSAAAFVQSSSPSSTAVEDQNATTSQADLRPPTANDGATVQQIILGPVDLTDDEDARLRVSVPPADGAIVSVRVWSEQRGWLTLVLKPAGPGSPFEIDLTDWAGQVAWIELVVVSPEEAFTPTLTAPRR